MPGGGDGRFAAVLHALTLLERTLREQPIDSSGMEAPPGVVDPSQFDVLITDILDEDYPSIAGELGCVRRLTPVETDGPFPVSGCIFGRNMRLFVPLTVFRRRANKAEVGVQVLFLLDTGSPATFMRKDTFAALDIDVDAQPMRITPTFHVQGQSLPVSVSHSHFANVDLLGQDYLKLMRGGVSINYVSSTLQLRVA